ncbi:MAG: hypothetical protein GXO65_07310 [Euryarchaeota archaeon]|nr:hypothetical protein [Euryarchaeota archaeon]
MDSDDKHLQDMAELLLSRATMLRYHCGTCRSPLFEKEGRVICPRCGPVKAASEEGEPGKSRKKGAVRDATRKVLEKKRDRLLSELEAEKDPKRITELLEAIEKMDRMLE